MDGWRFIEVIYNVITNQDNLIGFCIEKRNKPIIYTNSGMKYKHEDAFYTILTFHWN